MSLCTKLLIGYLGFVAALVVLGGWSAWRLREMGGVSRLYDSFLSEINRPPEGARPRPVEEQRRDEYFEKLEPQFNRLRGDCHRLLQLNQRAMLAKSEAAAGVAQRWFVTTLAIAFALVAEMEFKCRMVFRLRPDSCMALLLSFAPKVRLG